MELLNIVIPVYNSFDYLGDCLDSIPDAAGDVDYFITIVDNGSDKDKADRFYKKYEDMDNISIERFNRPLGFPRACNIGTKRKACPLIFFLNADVTLEPDSITELVKTMDDPEVGVVGMKLLFSEGTPHGPDGTVQHVGLTMNIQAKPFHLFLGWSSDNPRVNAMDDAWAVTGAALMTRRKIFNKVGGFEEKYGKGCLIGDTLINTGIGTIPLDRLDMYGGDYKLNIPIASNKETKNASLFHVNGEQEVMEIETQKRFSLTGTPNHKIISMNEEGNIIWRSLDDLLIGDYVALRRGSNLFGWLKCDDDLAYLAGLYIAEGSYEKKINYGRITITNKDKEICEFLEELGFSLSKDGIHWRSLFKHMPIVEKLKRDIGINFSQKSINKEIPDGILHADRHSQVSFLRGLFDGGGSGMRSGKVTYASSSKKLIKQLQIMLLNFGIVGAIYPKEEKMSDNTAYILDLLGDSRKFYEEIGFSISRKQENLRYVSERRSDTIPYQREFLRKLYGIGQSKEGGHWKKYSMHSQNSPHSVSRKILKEILVDFKVHKDHDAYKKIAENLDNDYVWVKVTKKESKRTQKTYDLHVPETNAYVANGFVVHNTFEDVHLCLTVKELGYKIKVNTDAVGYHYVGHTGMQYPLNQNYQLFMQKWQEEIIWNEWKYL